MGLTFELLANFPVLEAQALHAHTVLQIPAGIRGFFIGRKKVSVQYAAKEFMVRTHASNKHGRPATPFRHPTRPSLFYSLCFFLFG
jgi:hypothetical protein